VAVAVVQLVFGEPVPKLVFVAPTVMPTAFPAEFRNCINGMMVAGSGAEID